MLKSRWKAMNQICYQKGRCSYQTKRSVILINTLPLSCDHMRHLVCRNCKASPALLSRSRLWNDPTSGLPRHPTWYRQTLVYNRLAHRPSNALPTARWIRRVSWEDSPRSRADNAFAQRRLRQRLCAMAQSEYPQSWLLRGECRVVLLQKAADLPPQSKTWNRE